MADELAASAEEETSEAEPDPGAVDEDEEAEEPDWDEVAATIEQLRTRMARMAM